MLERIYIKEIQERLPYRDRRTIKKWCRNMGIGIFSDPGSNRQYILRVEFEIATSNKELIEYLISKYGEERAKNFLNDGLSVLELLGGNQSQSSYTPQGEHEKNFLKRLQSIL